MDETSLRIQLERALSAEPPLGNLVGNSLRAGRKLRRRRRVTAAALSAAAVAAVVAVPTLMSGASGEPPAVAPRPATARTAYITTLNGIRPIALATNAVGASIKVPGGLAILAVTPDGRTIYEAGRTTVHSGGYYSQYAVVTPIDTATNTARPAITLPSVPCQQGRYAQRMLHCAVYPQDIVIDPNGKTAYVASDGGIIPINLATRTAGTLIMAWPRLWEFTPDGKTLYVLNWPSPDDGPTVTPIRTATNTALAPIRLPVLTRKHGWGAAFPMAIAMTPNGKTAYVVAGVQGGKPYDNSVIPIDLATDRALAPIRLKASGLASGVVISPDGQTAYVLSPRAVTPINTATNEAGSAIKLPDADGLAYDIAQTPNGKRIYLVSPRGVIPIKLASRTVLPMISIPDVWTFGLFAITPDGRTVFVETNAGLLPISTRTNAGGKVIKLLRPSTVTFGG